MSTEASTGSIDTSIGGDVIVETRIGAVNFTRIDEAMLTNPHDEWPELTALELSIVLDGYTDRFKHAVSNRHDPRRCAALYTKIVALREMLGVRLSVEVRAMAGSALNAPPSDTPQC